MNLFKARSALHPVLGLGFGQDFLLSEDYLCRERVYSTDPSFNYENITINEDDLATARSSTFSYFLGLRYRFLEVGLIETKMLEGYFNNDINTFNRGVYLKLAYQIKQ